MIFFENDSETINKNSTIFLPHSGNDENQSENSDEQINDSGERSDHESTICNDDVVEISGESFIEDNDETNQSSSSAETFESAHTDEEPDNSVLDPTFSTRAAIPQNAQRPRTRNMSTLNLLNFHVAFMLGEPQNYEQAVNGNDKQQWVAAMKDEYESLIKNRTWELIDRPENQNVVDNKWVFKIKRKPDNSIERFKARLVARGFTQQYGIDYFETFSPVVRFTSIRIILAIASRRKMHLRQFDVKTAFLNGDLNENVFMEQPVGFTDGTNKVCKLIKGLYGLKQASRCWNHKFKHFIEVFGFQSCKSDPCVFVSYRKDILIVLAIHVDDGLIIADDIGAINCVMKHLQDKFEMKVMDLGCFLGLQIERNDDGSIFIHQAAYAKRVLSRIEMVECTPVMTPSDPNQPMCSFENSESSKFPYRELIGSLMYLAVATRPDIAHAVGIVSRYLEKPTTTHERAAKRILKYIKGTINFGIFFPSNDETLLSGYSDADYAGDSDMRRSTSGFVFMFGGSVISWNSERQKSVSLSTTESEYIAASNTVRELVWLRKFFDEILPNGLGKIDFYMDNQSAIRLVKNPEFHKRSKHIDVRYHFIREKYEEGLFLLNYIPTQEMIADAFTKSLPAKQFISIRTAMNVIDQQK